MVLTFYLEFSLREKNSSEMMQIKKTPSQQKQSGTRVYSNQSVSAYGNVHVCTTAIRI